MEWRRKIKAEKEEVKERKEERRGVFELLDECGRRERGSRVLAGMGEEEEKGGRGGERNACAGWDE